MYIPDPIEIMERQIEKNIDRYVEGHCMSCSEKVDYELIPISSNPDSIIVCYECLSPKDQKLYDEFYGHKPPRG